MLYELNNQDYKKVSYKSCFFGTSDIYMSTENYMKRVSIIAEYYHKRSKHYKNMTIISKFTRLVLTSIIPIISLIGKALNWNEDFITCFISSCAILSTISSGILDVWHSHDKWNLYRKYCDKLCREQILFAMKSGEYSNENYEECKKSFVLNCEKLISQEQKERFKFIKKSKKNKYDKDDLANTNEEGEK